MEDTLATTTPATNKLRHNIGLIALCAVVLGITPVAFAQPQTSSSQMHAADSAQSHSDAQSTASASANQPVILDLSEIDDELTLESAPVNGLRKKMLLNQPQAMIVMLSFEKDGVKAEHTVPGIATITIVEGVIDFTVLGKTHKLNAGQVIVLEPNTSHDLKALEKSLVLVTISKGTGS